MTASDRTLEFRQLAKEAQEGIPEAKRRKLNRPTKRGADVQKDGQEALSKQYMAEGYVILNHINTLSRMASAVRKPYLNLDARNTPFTRQVSRTIDLGGSDQTAWSNIKHLTNEERDQIDLQARVILSRCAERIKEMEALEKRRAELAASRTNPLARLLPARLRQDEATATSDFIAAHHASVTWYLSRRLTEASQAMKSMQEERMKRQMERTRTLGSGAAREAMFMTDIPSSSSSSSEVNSPAGTSGGWLGGASQLASNFMGASSLGDAASGRSTPKSTTFTDIMDDTEEEDEELELTQSQIMQFETENANILQNMQDALASVQQAESRLMEISALQMELVTHLTKQTEQTERMYDDAIATAATVEKGNVQLKEARRRARDSRKWILLFLIGASLSLLFLHYY
ncbi:snare protein syntaxin 18/UFE1 [Cytidiella melzeri]|nr:snare protein syntaxin 18/UFE1 [Cytidiella melzeri]